MTKTFGVSNKFINCCLNTFINEVQIDILQEECAELIKACSKLKRSCSKNEMLVNDLKEEMTHVLISSAMVAKIYGISEDDVALEVLKKAAKYMFDL